MSSVKNDKLHLIENSADFLDRPLPSRKNRSLESIHLKTVKKDKKVEKKIDPAPKILDKEDANKENKEQPYSSLVISSSSIHVGPTSAEERQRTGRYLAVGLTLIMLFIAFYHTVMRQTPVLAGLLPPAIIMVLYILWLLYFAKKRKRIEITNAV